MTYATTEDMIQRFSREELQSVAFSEVPAGIDEDKVSTAIADATSEINSYLVSRYELPLFEVPAIIKSVCCDLARYRMFANQATEEINTRYKDRITWLRSVAKGQAGLGISEKQNNTSAAVTVVKTSADRIFTHNTLGDY